ncbi:cell cycle checkpoint protein RAD1-like [Cimex lectularius]|uniref:Cell cycle checkpoint protein RAD1 n=1 Tax=Cimex lectularius TaxID=79782 RepID=A0A8I6SEU3_CIMLE|nr:cell cycle checkpoint protein RAD1-like [Cimex lectularius]
MLSQQSLNNCVLKAKLDNVKNLSLLLKCVQFKEFAVCYATQRGLKFLVEDSKCVQAAAFVGKNIFQEYVIGEELLFFKIELNVLIECLAILDGEAALNLYYEGHGFPLRLVLVEDDILTDCSIKTMETVENVHFSMPVEDVVNKMIVDGPRFKEVLSDLDPDSEYVEMLVSPDPPYFVVTTLSISGKCQVVLPKDADMIEEFSPAVTSVTRYKYSQIKPTMKTLQIASKVSVQLNGQGLLCLQFMVKNEQNQLAYIEFFCTPVLPEED